MAWNAVWDDIFAANPWGKYPAEDLIRFVARNFYAAPDRAAVRILEIGCGPGANLWYLAREGFSPYGIDGSAVAVRKAFSRLDGSCPGWRGEVLVGDMLSLPHADDFFDGVIDHEAVYCNSFADSVRIYREAARVLRPGGKLFVRTFAAGSWGDGTGQPVGRDAFLPSEGPMAGAGYARFTRREDFAELLGEFTLDSVEQLARTECGLTKRIIEWVVSATVRK